MSNVVNLAILADLSVAHSGGDFFGHRLNKPSQAIPLPKYPNIEAVTKKVTASISTPGISPRGGGRTIEPFYSPSQPRTRAKSKPGTPCSSIVFST